MKTDQQTNVCPVELAGGLDHSIRRFLQNPQKFVSPYIDKEMTVLDLGCGPGFFTVEIARLLNEKGKVIAADLQPGMLEKLSAKIEGTSLKQKIQLHQCLPDSIGLLEKVDFVFAFYMVHEVPDQDKLFTELEAILKPGGKLLIVEPRFHVNGRAFEQMMKKLLSKQFEIIATPSVSFSRAVLLERQPR